MDFKFSNAALSKWSVQRLKIGRKRKILSTCTKRNIMHGSYFSYFKSWSCEQNHFKMNSTIAYVSFELYK